jgi:hypothetical protein
MRLVIGGLVPSQVSQEFQATDEEIYKVVGVEHMNLPEKRPVGGLELLRTEVVQRKIRFIQVILEGANWSADRKWQDALNFLVELIKKIVANWKRNAGETVSVAIVFNTLPDSNGNNEPFEVRFEIE